MRLLAFVAEGEQSEYAATMIGDHETLAKADKAAIADLEAMRSLPIPLPSPGQVTQIVFDLEKRLMADIEAGREELRQLLRDGQILLHPKDGQFIAKSDLFPLVLLAAETQPPPRRTEAAVYVRSSGGRI